MQTHYYKHYYKIEGQLPQEKRGQLRTLTCLCIQQAATSLKISFRKT